ncbi:MAG: hypothetical protein ACLQQ4_02095 [Bacteroidia bacterium]
MSEEEKFDDILRSKLSERDFPFDETNWDKAEAMIESSEKRRRYGFISLIFLTGLMAGAGLMFTFMRNNVSSITPTTPILQQNNLAANPGQNNVLPSSNSPTEQPAKKAIAGNVTTSSGTNSQALASANAKAVQTFNSPAGQDGNATDSKTAKHRRNKHSADTTTQYSYVRPASEKSMKKKTYNNVLTNNTTNNVTPGTSPTTYNNQPLTVKEANSTKASQGNMAGTVAEDTLNKTQVAAASTSPVNKTDSTASANSTGDNQQQQPIQNSGYSHTLLSIDAGGGYSMGWQKAGGTQGNGLSPILGFSMTYYFSSHISACIGLQYNSLTNVNTLYTSSTSQYDFGTTNNVTSVTLKTLYYAALPVQLQYNLNDNNIISIGANVLYLVNSNSSVVSYNENYYGVSGYTSSYKTGYMDGINTWDAQVTLAYRRKIERFTISAEGYYGLLDIENNAFFGDNIFERNSGLRIILSYDIIK